MKTFTELSSGGERLWYVYSSDLDAQVQLKIGSLEGTFAKPETEEHLERISLNCVCAQQPDSSALTSLMVECRVISDGRELGCPTTTGYKVFSSRYKWNEWLRLPVKYCDLSRDSLLTLEIFDIHNTVTPHLLGSTTLKFFSKRGVFRQGIFDLKIWPFTTADRSVPSKTPGKLKSVKTSAQMDRLAKLSKKHRNGLIPKVDWLDRLTFREIEQINEKEKRDSNSQFLMVEFAAIQWNNIDHLVVYYEPNGDELSYFKSRPVLVKNPDPEIGMENLAELKHHILARSARRTAHNRDLKPNAVTRDQLNSIIDYPPTRTLSTEEKDLLWKFRHYLSTNKKGLAKFLKSVHWDQEYEVKQAEEMLKVWQPMDAEDALELLSPQFSHPVVRRYAILRLKSEPRDELLLYLLQLVQALKYENLNEICGFDDASLLSISGDKLSDVSSTVEESARWYAPAGEEPTALTPKLSTSVDKVEDPSKALSASVVVNPDFGGQLDLASFLISSAYQDPVFANYLYWYLKVECESFPSNDPTGGMKDEKQSKIGEMYNSVMRRLSKVLTKGGPEPRKLRSILTEQQVFVDKLVRIMLAVAKESGNRKRKVEYLQGQLKEQETTGSFTFYHVDGMPLPLNPEIKIVSVVSEKASLFNSALMPSKLTFMTSQDEEYVTIFKQGDDLRQDQLVLQIISLMDKLLRKDNLDLKLTPYRVIATSTNNGFVQFIEAQPLRDVIAENNGVLLNFFRRCAPSTTGPYGVSEEVIDNYVKSSAGYAVICYLLGVGDRHLHNLLLCTNGKLFHVDFGFILGRDPKPMPPPMKLTKEMIDGMGGPQSNQWREFCRLCYTTFLLLRRHANLILNLFSLMVDASIPDIAMEPDKTVKKVQERFRLDLDDESAVLFMQQIINDSVSAKMAAVVDFVHDLAVALRG